MPPRVSSALQQAGEIGYAVETSASNPEEASGDSGDIQVFVSLLDENGVEAAARTESRGTFKVTNPRLSKVWDSYLYHLLVRLRSGSILLDIPGYS